MKCVLKFSFLVLREVVHTIKIEKYKSLKHSKNTTFFLSIMKPLACYGNYETVKYKMTLSMS